MKTTHIDPRIGALGSGKFYAFTNGYDKPETIGTLREVELALGIHAASESKVQDKRDQEVKAFDVVMRFQYPAWDEMDGISFTGIQAVSKAEAIKYARREAERDGHATTGKGRYTFTATEV